MSLLSIGLMELHTTFVNNIIKISIIFFFLSTLQLFFTLDKGRSFFRSSNVDLFTSIIKERKFIDTVENLTIFVEKKIIIY